MQFIKKLLMSQQQNWFYALIIISEIVQRFIKCIWLSIGDNISRIRTRIFIHNFNDNEDIITVLSVCHIIFILPSFVSLLSFYDHNIQFKLAFRYKKPLFLIHRFYCNNYQIWDLTWIFNYKMWNKISRIQYREHY